MDENKRNNSAGAEFTPLPDEFSRDGGIQPEQLPKKQRWKRMVLMLAACCLLVYGGAAGEIIGGAPSHFAAPVITELPPTPAVSAAPTLTGVIRYTIYNSSFDNGPESKHGIRVLDSGEWLAETLAAGERYALPEPEQPPLLERFTFRGWVAWFKGLNEDSPTTRLLSDGFTAEDAACICPDENGDRTVEIYAVWQRAEESDQPYRLRLVGNGGTVDGKTEETWDTATPLGSGGQVFLCAYPIPERAGYRFTGWYREKSDGGAPVEVLSAMEFYEIVNEELDWHSMKTVTLLAGWEPETKS